MLSDVWQNVSREHLLETQLALFESVLTYALPPVGGRHDGIAIAEQMEVLMRQAQSDGWKIGAIVTDNAGQCGRARRILALRWPQVVFLFCFAHVINNIVKSVLKTSFRDVAAQAASVVNTLNASSSKWLYFARDMMKSFYGKHLGLFTFCETRWDSMQSCFASILRVRTSLQALATKYKQREDFPDSLQILNNSSFWDKLAEAEQVISPLAEASYRLQRDENTMADVVVSLRDIYRGFARNSTCGHELVKCVEDRWGQCEQPLFMLGLVLHPAFVKEAQPLFDKSTPVSGREQFGRFAVYYYWWLVGEDFGTIRRDIQQWMDGEYTRTTADEFPGDVVGFWRTLQDEHLDSRLPQLAIAVLSVCVNTATCERLFSELGLIHTARWNRMSSEKAAKTQIICKHVRNHDRKVVTETGLVIRVTCPIERELVGAGRRYHRREEQHDISLQSPGCPSPALQTPLRPADNEEDDDLLDDPGDRIDGEQVFSLWDKYLVDVFTDEEVENDFRQMSGGTNSLNAAQTTAAIFEQDELAEIPQPLNMSFPSRNDPLFPLERSLDGIRTCKATLSMLFGSSFGNETQLV